MLHVIDRSSRSEGAVLGAMFEARKRVFVDLLRWNVPVLGGSWEMDQFDTQDATYLVLADALGSHLASARLLRTDRPHILDTLFPKLCDKTPPASPDTREITRFCLDRSLRAACRRQCRNRLVTALVQHALASGITRYTAVADMSWAQQILAFGWRCIPLGPSRDALIALSIEIDADTPARLAAAGTWLETTNDTLAHAA
jgi:N-acyl-L-homoserine lactone synthetase